MRNYQLSIEQLEKEKSDASEEINGLKKQLHALKSLNLKHEDKIDLLLTELSNT